MVVVSGSGLFLYEVRDRVRTESERNLARSTFVFAKQIEQLFATVESVQAGIIKDVARLGLQDLDDSANPMSRYEIHLKLRDKVAGMLHVGSLTIISARGRLINFSRQWPIPDVSAADRDFVKVFRTNPHATSFIGTPIRNRITGSRIIPVARKISGPNGEFLGLTMAAVEPRHLESYFGKIALYPDHVITLSRHDGMVLARLPKDESIIGRRFKPATGLDLVSVSDGGVRLSTDVIDGSSRIVAAQRVGAFPLVITAAVTTDAVYAGWWHMVAYVVPISALAVIGIAALAFLFIRAFKNHHALIKARAEQKHVEKFREQSLRFDAALNNMSQGLLMFDASGRIVVCNKRYIEMYGLSPETVKPGLALLDLIKHRKESGLLAGDPDEFYAQILQQVAKQEPSTQLLETTNGRMIHIIHQPMADGGWVSTHEDITERYKVERERDYNRKFMDMVIENVPSTVVVKNVRDFSYALINRAAEEYFGIPRDKMIGKTVHDFLPKESADYLTELDKKLLTASQPIVDEHSLEMHGGEKHVAVSKRLCIRDEEGEPRYLLAVVDDITAQRETETQLREQRQQLDAAITNMAQGLVMFDSSERVVLCNQRYIEMSGLSPDFMRPGRTLREILQKRQDMGGFSQDIDEYCRQLREDIAHGNTKCVVVETADGRSFNVVNVPMTGGGWVATHEEVTEKLRAEKLIAEQKFQLDVALSNMSQGICMFDATQRLIVCNKRYAEIYGLTDEQTRPGTTLRTILQHRIVRGTAPNDHEGYVNDRIREVVENKPYQVINQLGDGRWVHVIHQPTADGGWVATHEDITEAKAREESFRLLFEGNPVPMWVTDPKSLRFIAVNEAAIAHYGYTRDQFLAMKVPDLRPAGSRSHFARHLRSLPDVQLIENTGQHLKADGTQIDVVVFSRVLNYGGRRVRLAVIHDITQVKLAEDELRKTKRFLNAVVENVPLPIIVKSVPNAADEKDEFRFTLINRAAEDHFGVSRDQLIGKRPHDIHPKRHADFVVKLDGEVLQASKPILIEQHDVKLSNNETRTIVSRKVAIRDENQEAKFLLTLLEDVTERNRAEQRISYLAHNDSLTGLPNRSTFVEMLASTLDSASRSGEQFSILCVDLDHFKEANDVHGHLIGDELLREAARRLRMATADTFLARVGGDEFTLIVKDGPQPETAKALGERMLAAFKDDFEVDGHRLQLGMSIGGAVYPSDGTDAKTLLANADAALYQAKAEARGSVQFFEEEMGVRLRERRELQKDLQLAVAQDEFLLHYQPQLKMETNKVIGLEALVRWQCPRRGLVAPGQFIPIAEESGLIIPLGEWILREACREAASWAQPLTVAVNISPIQFHYGDLPRLVHSILLDTGLSPSRLELEITEGVLIDDFSRAVSILRRLKSIGVQIAMDDFGSGYSSLSYLHSFPFDKIKIDRSFVCDLEHNHHSMAIARAVITLGHSLNVPVLAEGVETEAQRRFLVQEGCDEVQGYLTGRPSPIESYARLVGRDPEVKQAGILAG